ncbi:hypothetical protein [Vibrio sp. FYR_4]|uniref:hypothetical protein n=1 Tax=Vibrio sp. FYR_4 TaxID=3367172 RepID=UPI00370C9F68
MSLATSRKQIAASAKQLDKHLGPSFNDYHHIINWGCGKWPELTEQYWLDHYPNLTKRIHYDPNSLAPGICVSIPYGYETDILFCANVLNVLDDDLLAEVLSHIASLNFKAAVIQIHEGDKYGQGRVTRCGYQRNERTSAYLPYLLPFFSDRTISVRSRLIIIS